MIAKDFSFEEIKVGSIHEFTREILDSDVNEFAKLTGDFNPLHTNEDYASKTKFKKKVVHGMLASSLFSTLVGMYCPGKRNLYLAQSINFRQPIFVGMKLVIRGIILSKSEAFNTIKIKTEVLNEGNVMIDGEAVVKLI